MVETTIDLTEVLNTYLDAWNTPDADERVALLERSVSDDVEFIDPTKKLVGRQALAEHIADVRTTFPDITFAPGGEHDTHNNVVRGAWLARRGDVVVLRGIDIDDVAPDGRLSRIIGFFDRPAEK